MRIPIYHIDAFTDKVFSGNPVAVCPLDAWPDDAVMQAIAAENSLARALRMHKALDAITYTQYKLQRQGE